MPDMLSPLEDLPQPPQQPLSETEYQRLRAELSLQLKQELRRTGQQHLFAIGIHALTMLFLAVILFVASRKYHDLMLWAVGVSLLLFSLLEFMDLDFLQSGHSLLDVFRRKPKQQKTVKTTLPTYIPEDHS